MTGNFDGYFLVFSPSFISLSKNLESSASTSVCKELLKGVTLKSRDDCLFEVFVQSCNVDVQDENLAQLGAKKRPRDERFALEKSEEAKRGFDEMMEEGVVVTENSAELCKRVGLVLVVK